MTQNEIVDLKRCIQVQVQKVLDQFVGEVLNQKLLAELRAKVEMEMKYFSSAWRYPILSELDFIVEAEDGQVFITPVGKTPRAEAFMKNEPISGF